MKAILSVFCGLLIGTSAAAADLELKCRGELDRGKPATTTKIEFIVSVSGEEVIVRADPKYDIGGAPAQSVLKLVLKESDAARLLFESVERSNRAGEEASARIGGIFFRGVGRVYIIDSWPTDEYRMVAGDCEILVGTRRTILPNVT